MEERRHSLPRRLMRMLRLRLVIPLVRSGGKPENTARAVAVGLLYAFTPTFGIQMVLTLVHWYISRNFFNKDFNVIVAMAWTWVTNLVTVPICYYAFFLTGQTILGRWHDLTGFESFSNFWETAMGRTGGDPTSLQAWEIYFSIMVEGWGLAIVVGSIPYAIIGYIVGYHWTLRVAIRWRAAKQLKKEALAKKRL
tara:strand:+ start:728 stop:1312 length:585 start_codon:yes stop_codon:yes gene_type:complete